MLRERINFLVRSSGPAFKPSGQFSCQSYPRASISPVAAARIAQDDGEVNNMVMLTPNFGTTLGFLSFFFPDVLSTCSPIDLSFSLLCPNGDSLSGVMARLCC